MVQEGLEKAVIRTPKDSGVFVKFVSKTLGLSDYLGKDNGLVIVLKVQVFGSLH
jgi:hypothetical protein